MSFEISVTRRLGSSWTLSYGGRFVDTSVLGHPELRERSFAVFSFGKTLHATGLRLVVVLVHAVTDERELVSRLELLLDAKVNRVTPIRVDLVDDTTTVEVHYALAPRPVMPRAERHDVPAVTR